MNRLLFMSLQFLYIYAFGKARLHAHMLVSLERTLIGLRQKNACLNDLALNLVFHWTGAEHLSNFTDVQDTSKNPVHILFEQKRSMRE